MIVFKKKRRKGYRKKNGHRQSLTEIVIEGIVSSGAKKAAPKAKAAAPKAEAPKAKAAPAQEEQDYTAMTVAQLKAVAKEKGISGISGMKKADLIDAIKNV